MEKVKNLLKSLIIDKSTWEKTKDEIAKENQTSLRVFSVIGTLLFFILTIVSFAVPDIGKYSTSYVVFTLIFIVMTLLSFFATKNHKWLIRVLIHFFLLTILAFGILLGTFVNPETPTISYVVLLFACPLLFTEKSLFINIDILVSVGFYALFAVANGQDKNIFANNMINIVIFGLISLCVSVYLSKTKFQKALFAYNAQVAGITDKLTGLGNRHLYESEIKRISDSWNSDVYTLFAFDLNGLKVTNDKYGHSAGDALLTDAATCIEKVFSKTGKVFRIGGDEFAVIINGRCAIEKELCSRLAEETAKMKGPYGNKLSISVGVACTGEVENTKEWIVLADQRMYKNKANFYEKSGFDRRKA
ncbi:MAG: GGDEF domain-containing protein [Bacilli bacterium]|nr:GGDEF domain-containing protein [Bacilli bacterium]